MLTYDPNTGFLVNGQRANLYGRVGRNVLDANTAAGGALNASAYDPRFYEAYQDNDGDAGQVTRYRLRPEVAERVGNRTQLASHSVGGYGEVIDPSQVDYDEEFGLLTDRRNIKDPATPRDNLIGNLAMAAFAAPIAYGVALNSGLLGAGGALNTVSGLEPITLPALEGAPTLTSLEGLGTGAGAGAGAGASAFPAGAGIAGPALETAGMATNVPWYTQALANAGVNLTNPMMVARGLMGLSSLANSLKPSSGGGSDAPGGSGDITPANVARFNPAGLLANYRAPTFDPVPFMSGKYGLLGK
jgi:hypothetical protein